MSNEPDKKGSFCPLCESKSIEVCYDYYTKAISKWKTIK